MTIASQTSRIAYTGDGVTTAFAVPFYFAANIDLVVVLQDTSGNQIAQTLGTHYNLSGATVSAGGTCTFNAAPTTAYVVTIYRDPAMTQTTSYNNNDAFPAKSHELALDKLTTIAQRSKDLATRSIRQADGETPIITLLTAVASRKNKLLGFGSNGELIYPLGPTFVAGTAVGVVDIDSRATAQVTTIAASTNIIHTRGYATPGDRGGAVYKRVVSQPTHSGKFQSAEGTWWELVPGEKINILQLGGKGDASTDNLAALTAAYSVLSALYTFGGCICFPPGQYNFSASSTFTYPNTIFHLTLEGAGQNATTLNWNTGDGLIFTQRADASAFHQPVSSLKLRGLAFTTGATNATAVKVSISDRIDFYNYQLNNLTDVSFRGNDPTSLVNTWATAVSVISAGNFTFDSVNVFGVGACNGFILAGYSVSGTTNGATAAAGTVLNFASTPALTLKMFAYDLTTPAALTSIAVNSSTATTATLASGVSAPGVGNGDTIIFTNSANIYNFSKCNFINVGYCISLQTGVQGVTVSQCNFTGGTNGILASANMVGLLQLNVSDSQFNTTSYQIITASPVGATNLHNNLFFQTANSPAVYLQANAGFAISNNIIDGNGVGTGIQVNTSTGNYASTITGNAITNLTNGIVLSTGTTKIFAGSNEFTNVTTQYSNLGTDNTIEMSEWVPYTPVVSGIGGAVTATTTGSKYRNRGKAIEVYITATYTAIAGGVTGSTIPLPLTSDSTVQMIPGHEVAISGKLLRGQINTSSPFVQPFFFDGTAPLAVNQVIVLQGEYRIP